MLGQIETNLLTIIGSSFGAWLAAKLAFRRFSQEKVWERKAAAYSAIFEALHYIGRWYDKNYEASLIAKDIDDEKTRDLKEKANAAEEELERRLASETWLIPDECRTRLERMTEELKKIGDNNTMWQPFLEESSFAVHEATRELRSMVRKDLKLLRPWHRRVLERQPKVKKWPN